MKVILLVAAMSSCAVGDEDFFNRRPCRPTNKRRAFENFERNHILPENFDTSSTPAWESHIARLKRCGEPTQTFVERSNTDLVVKICNGNGWNRQSNLCTSNLKLPTYVVKVVKAAKSKCRVKATPRERKQHVTVACDKVGGRCLPVHIEGKPQTGGRPRAACSPAAPRCWSDKRGNISIWVD